ncbi:hypothetical protein [Kutzneria albida]|uniref:Uncharacterized protein n=1 Tax=Kutzneria albida DSM 43870 TaxID=1449976 RepID=W5WF77_9PSEU|nr:hypothetical protein [Kutzneria albida]AHH99858.1 hypothetical protein KALB_6499 [Kutzneria albida DSM 43870]
MDLVERAGELKGMLVDFALSPRFDNELTAVIWQSFPDGVVDDEAQFTMVLDHFALQRPLRSGGTVVEAFVASHPELSDVERDMLLGWRDVVEGIFEVRGKDRDAVLLSNFVDELTYRARSNLGRTAFTTLRKRMIVVGRLVRVGDDWVVSGNPAAFPASARDQMLAAAAQEAMRNPAAVFRNPEKLAEARRMLAEQHDLFVELFGADLIVVAGSEVSGKVREFYHHVARQVRPDAESPDPASLSLDDADWLTADRVAIHFVPGEGLSFYPDFHLIEEVFANPALLSRRRYREALTDLLRDPDTSPEPLRRLAARDVSKANAVFENLLKRKRGFRWDTEGEALLRQHKPGYFDGSQLPRTVPLSKALSDAFQHSHP